MTGSFAREHGLRIGKLGAGLRQIVLKSADPGVALAKFAFQPPDRHVAPAEFLHRAGLRGEAALGVLLAERMRKASSARRWSRSAAISASDSGNAASARLRASLSARRVNAGTAAKAMRAAQRKPSANSMAASIKSQDSRLWAEVESPP
jgi:hypothetical protein